MTRVKCIIGAFPIGAILLFCFSARAQHYDTPFGSSVVLDVPVDGSVVDAGTNHFTVITNNGGTFITNRFGQPNSAFSLNGTDQNVVLPYDAKLYPDEMSLSMWVNFQQFNAVPWRSGDPNSDGWRGFAYEFLNSQGRLQYEDFDGFTFNAVIAAAETNFTIGQWQQIVVTRSSNACAFFVNGIKAASQTNLTPYAKPQVGPMSLGANISANSFYSFCPMALDNVHIYNRALSDTEVQTLFAAEASLTDSPVIISEPASQTVASGNDAVLTVSATGYPILSYQWSNQGGEIADATNSTLTVANVQLGDAGYYYVVVTNLHGSVTSSNATLTVTNQAPSLTAQPQSATLVEGDSAMFTVVAGGSKPINYQWWAGLTSIPGETNSTLTLANVQVDDSGNYYVVVTNLFGSTTSSNATLAVIHYDTPFGSSLVLDVPVDGSVVDVSAHHFNLSTNNGGTFITNRFGQPESAFLLDGVSQYLSIPYNAQLYPDEMTLSIWVNLQQFGGSVWRTGNASSDGWRGFDFEFADAQGSLLYEDFDGNGYNALPVADGTNFAIGQWRQVVLTRTTNSVSFFVNGIKAASQTNLTAYAKPQITAMLLGANYFFDDSIFGHCSMALDNVHIYNRALSDTEVQTLFAAEVSAPNTPILGSAPKSRLLRTTGAKISQGENAEVSIVLDAQGNENTLRFTLLFDPAAFTYNGLSLGIGAAGASLTVDCSQVALGRLGVVLELPQISTFTASSKELLRFNFTASSSDVGLFPFVLSDDMITRGISDLAAIELPVGYMAGLVTINPVSGPELTISQENNNVVLSWPLWATGYTLQMLHGSNGWQGAWTDTPASVQTNSSSMSKTLPMAPESKFFRLFHP